MDSPILALMPPSLDELARGRIRSWIASTGVTQTALAERIGRNQAWMSRYLAADFDADLSTLQKIAEVFGHSLNALLDTPRDPQEAALIESYRALSPADRQLARDLLARWSRPRRRGRSRREPAR
jgi:transcriptional regulator with XRE-family HTH domain